MKIQHKHINLKMLLLQLVQRPIEIPGFKFSERVIDSTGALSLKEIPKKLLLSVAVTLVLSLVLLMLTSVQKLHL